MEYSAYSGRMLRVHAVAGVFSSLAGVLISNHLCKYELMEQF
jgi:hypothetical protein